MLDITSHVVFALVFAALLLAFGFENTVDYILRFPQHVKQVYLLGPKRTILDLFHSPHILCPFEHLTIEQWRKHAQAWKEWLDDSRDDWSSGLTLFEWLENEGLPPLPHEEYDPVSQRWVKDMPRYQRKAYLQSLK